MSKEFAVKFIYNHSIWSDRCHEKSRDTCLILTYFENYFCLFSFKNLKEVLHPEAGFLGIFKKEEITWLIFSFTPVEASFSSLSLSFVFILSDQNFKEKDWWISHSFIGVEFLLASRFSTLMFLWFPFYLHLLCL